MNEFLNDFEANKDDYFAAEALRYPPRPRYDLGFGERIRQSIVASKHNLAERAEQPDIFERQNSPAQRPER